MISEWDQPAELQTPSGSLFFNQPFDTDSTRRLLLNPRRCSSRGPVRLTEDDISQGDGSIPHRRFRSGYTAHLAFEFVSEYDEASGESVPADGADLVEMEDIVGLHVNEMIRTGLVPGSPNARYIWTPSGQPDNRMLDRIQLAGDPTFTYDGDLGCSLYEIDVDTPFPYYIAATENEDVLSSGETQTLTNLGNTDFFPVVEVYGPYTAFALFNHSVTDLDGNPTVLAYDSLLPGASDVDAPDFIEFLFFNGTAYLNNNQANRKAGIDFELTDWWPLIPGANEIEFLPTGGSGTDTVARIFWNHAWA